MTAETQIPRSLERLQTPDQHPIEDIHGKAGDLLDLYVRNRAIKGARSSRVIWANGIETYSEFPDDRSRSLFVRFEDVSLEVKERIVTKGKKIEGEDITAPEKITYSDQELNLLNSDEAFSQIRKFLLERIPTQV